AADAPLDDEPVVTAAIDMLRWAAGDESALARLLASPLSGLDPVEVRTLRRQLSEGSAAVTNTTAVTDDPRLGSLVALRLELQERLATDDPAALVFGVWERALGPLLVGSNDPADDRAIDAFVAFYDGLTRQVDRTPALRVPEWLASLDGAGDRWRATRPTTDSVTVASVSASAGRQWHTVVIVVPVLGDLPAIDAHPPVLDPPLSERPTRPPACRRR